jgi:hypothetical protein
MSYPRSILLCVLAAFSFTSVAQEAAPTVWSVQAFRVNPGTQPVFEQIVTKYKEAAEKVGAPAWYAYSPAIGNDFVYEFATEVESFTMFSDQSDIVMEAFGAEEAMKIGEMARISIADVESFTVIQRPDLGIAGPEMDGPPEASIAYRISLKPGMEEEWEAWMRTLIDVTKQTAPDAYWTSFWGGLGLPNAFAIRVNMKWADMDNPVMPIPQRLAEVHGDRKAKRMYKDAIGMVESIETYVSRFRTDLSHMPAAAEE